MKVALAAVALLFATPALARHGHHHRPFHGVQSATSHHRHHGRSYASSGSSSIETVETLAGPIRVAAAYAERFVGFINALVDAGYKPKDIGCYAPRGHMPGSKHHWGGACDIDQTDRNVTSEHMRHITELAHKFNLTDGCEWRDKDCGHIEVPGQTRAARRTRYAGHHHHYARAG